MEIKARLPKLEKESVVDVDFHDASTTSMIDWAGEEQVKSAAVDSWTITLQSAMRRWMEAGKDQAEIQKLANEWKPGVVVRGVVDPIQSTLGKFAKMSNDEQEAFMEALKARLAAKG
jgi:hypothetical protein